MVFYFNFSDRAYPPYWVGCLLLLCVSHLSGKGYIFVKEGGIPERLIPQDCPVSQVPEVTELTPTQAHMYALQKAYTVSWLDTSDGKTFKLNIKPHLDTISQILENEQRYRSTHYIFYHGQNGSFRLLQDIFNELYTILQIEDELRNFKFFRAWSDAIPVADVNAFLDYEETSIFDGSFFDMSARLQKKLLSVNVSLFGNKERSSSCTFDYFIHNTSASVFDLDWVIKGIKSIVGLDLTPQECKLLQDLANRIGSAGSLFQICIPHEQVDRCVYLSEPGGIPYSWQLIKNCYDTSKQRHIRISDILDAYIKPGFLKKFSYLDGLQARILMSQDIMLNPKSGVKIFRFTSSDKKDTYQKELTQFVHALMMRYLEKAPFLGSPNAPFERIASLIFNR